MNKLTEEYDMMFKILLLGDSGVGKSSLLLRYTKNQFNPDIRSTIGVEFGVKFIEIDNIKLKIQIWDTAGMERYRSLTSSYYKGAKGVVIVYDICRKESFDQLKQYWINEIKANVSPNTSNSIFNNKYFLIYSSRYCSK